MQAKFAKLVTFQVQRSRKGSGAGVYIWKSLSARFLSHREFSNGALLLKNGHFHKFLHGRAELARFAGIALPPGVAVDLVVSLLPRREVDKRKGTSPSGRQIHRGSSLAKKAKLLTSNDFRQDGKDAPEGVNRLWNSQAGERIKPKARQLRSPLEPSPT